MNKYQEAYHKIFDDVEHLGFGEIAVLNTLNQNDKDTLKELTDKATPTKVNLAYKNAGYWICPKCQHEIGCQGYCDNCGQKLDFDRSDENE